MKEHGASKMTVHRALRELSAEGVVRRVERVGTFVVGAGSAPSRKIGLVLPTTQGFLEFNILAGIRDGLDARDQYILYATENDPVTEADAIDRAASEVDGILIVPTAHAKNCRRLQELCDSGFPVVCMDRACVGFNLPAVTTNNFEVSQECLKKVKGDGPRRVGYFGIYDPAVSSLADRYRAYRETCIPAEGADPTELVRFIPPHLGDHAQVSFRLLEDSLIRLLSGPEPMSLAFCANEYFMEAIIQVCHRLPREMSDKLEILSFNEWPRLRYHGFRIHTIRQNARAVGKQAADLLHRLWLGEKIEARSYEVPATFIHADDPFEVGPFQPTAAHPGGLLAH
jgi:DNA-binding LacI/PurR family transcriptional regulator